MTGVPCGCSRSKSGFCDGSHGLSPESWAKLQESLQKDQFLNEKTEDKNRGSDHDLV
jgi:CDGSH-type Zn-finger protein